MAAAEKISKLVNELFALVEVNIMALCSLSNLTKYYGADLIFKNITFEINKGQRLGLIGPNGVGKTTLLRILMGYEDYHDGSIFKRSDIRIDYLDQTPSYPPEWLTINVLSSAFDDIFTIQKRLQELEQQMAVDTGPRLQTAIAEYGRLEQAYEQRGGYVLHDKLKRILVGLKIDEQMQQRPFELLSGGEKSRIVLGKILLEEPDILLLDEPSNHLDLQYMGWLESYIQEYQGAVVIVSHDRWFLNRAISKIIEIERDGVEIYNGNYSYYQVERQRRLEEKFRNWQAKQKQVDRLEDQIEQYLIWGRARDSEVMFKRAKELKKRLAKIDVPDKPVMESKKIRLRNDNSGRSAKEVVRFKNVGHGFSDKSLFTSLNFTAHYQDRIAIIGPNGSGKSTLIKLIVGEYTPLQGQVELGSRVKIGYLPQEVEFANPADTLVEAFQREYNITITQARHQLAKALFTGDDVFKTVAALSGGERSRLKLFLLMYGGANVLILDEPTNHLDIDSREELEKSLGQFSGTIIFVSHDRYFIDSLATKILKINHSQVLVCNGNYQYYLDYFQPRQQAQTVLSPNETSTNTGKQEYQAQKNAESQQRRQQRQLQNCEQSMARLESQLKELELQMTANAANADLLAELYCQQQQAEEELLQLIARHEKLVKIVTD